LLADSATKAVEVLTELLKEDAPSVKLAACRAILDHTMRTHALLDVEDRLVALEAAVDGRGRLNTR